MATCTELLRLDFYGGCFAEAETTVDYEMEEAEHGRPARVRVNRIESSGVDLLPMLYAVSEPLVRKLEAQILKNERQGVYA